MAIAVVAVGLALAGGWAVRGQGRNSPWEQTRTNGVSILTGPIRNPANGHYYYLLSTGSWSNSEAAAVSLGGHLVTINDAAENEWVVKTFADFGGEDRPLWIGLTDRKREGTFKWVSGESFRFANWNLASAEPNNSGGSGYEEDFAYIIQQHSGNPTVFGTFWNDVPDDGYGVSVPLHGVVEVAHGAPPVLRPTVRARSVEVCWPTQRDVHYQLEWKAPGGRGGWVRLGEPVAGTGEELCVEDMLGDRLAERKSGTKSGTYRVKIVP